MATAAQDVAAARVAQDAKTFRERAQFPRPEGARSGDLFLVLRQRLGQPAAAQQGAGPGPQFAQVKLLGLAVLVVEIAAAPAVAPGQPDGDEAFLCLEMLWRNGRWHLLFPHAPPR